MLDLYLLQETLLYVEQQHEWLSYIQSAINEKEQKYKILHSKLTTRITEELNKTVVDDQSNEIIVKQECCDSDHEARCFKIEEDAETYFDNFIQNYNHQDQVDVPETSNDGTLTNQSILHEITTNCNRMTSDNMNCIGNEDVLNQIEVEQFNNEQIDVKQNDNSCNDDQEKQLIVSDDVNLNHSNHDLSGNIFHARVDVGSFHELSATKQSADNRFSEKNSSPEHKNTKGRFFCLNCNKSFSTNANLKIHMRIHTGEDLFKCSVCHKSFTHLRYLRIHRRIHTDEKPFKCSYCYIAFREKSTLRRHIRIHTGEKPFKCSVCHKSFNRKFTLRSHFRIHTGEKPFKCTVCQKSFTQKSNLNTHYQIHIDEKPYKCSICHKSFTRKVTLRSHFRMHSGEKPFKCSLCHKSFTRKFTLRSHFLIHSGEKS